MNLQIRRNHYDILVEKIILHEVKTTLLFFFQVRDGLVGVMVQEEEIL